MIENNFFFFFFINFALSVIFVFELLSLWNGPYESKIEDDHGRRNKFDTQTLFFSETTEML